MHAVRVSLRNPKRQPEPHLLADLDKGNEEALQTSSRMRTAEAEVTRLGFELQSAENANARMKHGLEFQIAQNAQLIRGKEELEEEVQVG